ncbi:MAG TPA: DNA translocase FtsK 4TM domain-containing protein [Puia sp.]|nr:DNA translocase FtsK 4TM domain-containing protein [Puia sp.]
MLIFAGMAKRKKSKKSQPNSSNALKADKEERVTVKEIAKDERTHKIIGALFLLAAIFLFVAFTSYLFTWKEDQSNVENGISFLHPSANTTANLLGNIGAYVSHIFFYNGFGLASYFLCSLFFVLGVNLLFTRKIFSVSRNVRYVIAGLIYFSVLFAFFGGKNGFPWGGEAGNMISEWLIGVIGKIGTLAVLVAGGLAYIIWRFNPVFKVPAIPGKMTTTDPGIDEEALVGAKLFVDQSFQDTQQSNIRGEGKIIVIPPKLTTEGPTNGALLLTSKESMSGDNLDVALSPSEAEIPPIGRQDKKSGKKNPNIELEIKATAEANENEANSSQEPALESTIDTLTEYEPTLELRNYQYPSLDLLETHGSEKIVQDPTELETNKNQIINTLKNYDIEIQKISATVGPTVTLYEIVPAPGIRISRIKNLEDDIALSLAALGIRIIAPIPGKGTVGIEVPNVRKSVVSMKTLLASEKFQNNHFALPIAIGKKIDNENLIVDLTAMPHLLMAGATGQGKSVGINTLLVSLLYKKHPSQLKFVLVDPKKVELSLYRVIEKYFLIKINDDEEPIITDTKKVIYTLNALCEEMDQRYDYLKEAGCRNIKEYNEKFVKRKLNPDLGHKFLPFIILIIDEFADLIMTAGKEIEMPIARLAQLARAVGIHLIIATQRPSVNIITGTIKANFPARIAFKVSSKIDSRTILDTGGAEQLIGKGDMLISYNGEITRLQCAFVDTPEVEKVCDFIGDQRGAILPYVLPKYEDAKDLQEREFDKNDKDELFEEAARLIVQNQVGSTSLLQRRMKLGYNRAGRLMDQLEQAGIVGKNLGSKARDVLIKTEYDLDQHLTNIS